MKSFADAKGQAWDVAVTVSTVTLVRSRLDLCLFPLTKADAEPLPGEESKPKKDRRNRHIADLERLQDATVESLALFVDLLWVLCEKQAESRGVSPADFAAGLDDLDTYMAARAAVDEALTLFSLSRDQKIAAEEMYRAKTHRAAAMIDQARATILAELAKTPDESTPGKPSGDSPESSASTPAP